MPHPVKRSACDRCHAQKLRCIRESGGACVRCVKVSVTCTWSPSLRRQREARDRRDNSAISPNSLSLDDADMETNSPQPITVPMDTSTAEFNQPGLDFELGPNIFSNDQTAWSGPTFVDSASSSSTAFGLSRGSPVSVAQLQSQDTLDTWQYRFNQEWAMLSAEQQPTPDINSPQKQHDVSETTACETSNLPLATIRDLSALSVDLFTLSSAVPKPPVSISQPLSWKNKDFAIDKTFQLSQTFIESIDKMYPRHPENSSLSPTQSPAYHSSPPISGSCRPTSFDQSSFLLVLSCYQRLIETYDDIFGNMQACLDRSSVTAREDYVQMPDVKVGSFSLPNSSALQITLILQLARHLIRRMGIIIKTLNQGPNAATDDASDLMSLTFKALSTRESDLVERINKLRNTLVSLDIL
ncbi:hypothetical protein F4820DRAFT_131413 [Hypoxylon rubiginosum]|uniref:Uncharacterized protein n=1 Tax=Hypoxylon rubiginosum TaxID=110542 RepID=A0ACB9YKL3_9PEZI|nr:hypothetical protein F4820DRAFT_131413 [Hypoxylon rubiginosum]